MVSLPPAEPPPVPGTCANCGALLVGAFCHQCGQREASDHLSLRAMAAEAMSQIVDLEHSQLFRTGRALIAQPGRLTNEYIAGRRVGWISPLKIYLTIFAVSIFLYSAFKSVAIYDVGTLARADRTGMMSKMVTDLAAKKHVAEDAFIAAVNGHWHTYSTVSQILYPLLFAAALKIFYLRRKFGEHLVFSLHYQALALLIVIVAWPLYMATGIQLTEHSAILAAVVMTVMVVYLLFALRRVYRENWPMTVAKSVVLYGAYYLIYTGVTYGTLVVAILVTMRTT